MWWICIVDRPVHIQRLVCQLIGCKKEIKGISHDTARCTTTDKPCDSHIGTQNSYTVEALDNYSA
jgi:hypothetical protein